MVSKHRTLVGVKGGIMAGASIVGPSFLLYRVRLRLLATPLALGGHLFGPGGPFLDTPVLSQLLSITIFAGNLLTLTSLHFLAF
jgi:hypothetical protein